MVLLLTVSTRMTRRSIIPSRSPVHGFPARLMVRVPPAVFCGACSLASAMFPERKQ